MSLKTHSSRQGRNKDFSFNTGDLVLVKWGDGMVYFAKVKRIDTKKRKCTVVFDDKSQDEADFSQIHSVDETTTDIICIKCKKDNSDSPNEIVLCDMCGIGFHQKCHVPPIPVSALQLDMPWNCSYCQQGVKCPFLTESLDVLQNLLSDDNEATSGDEEDGGGMESEYHEVVRDDSSSSRRGRKRKGRSALHARQERRKSLRLHTPTPEVSSLATTEKKSSEIHSPEAKEDISKIDDKSPMGKKRKKLVHMKRMKRSSVESRTVSVHRIDTPIYEEAPPNFFSPFTPESDDYSPSKVMLSSVANTSPEKLEDSKGFDLETIPETPLVDETPPKLKERQLRVSLSLHSDVVEKGSPGKSKLKSPLLFGSVTSWDDVISPKSSEKSLSCESSPKSHQSRTESLKEEAFVASPLPSSSPKVLQHSKIGAGVAKSNSSTPVEPKSSPFSESANTEISPIVKSVSSTIASLSQDSSMSKSTVTPEGTMPVDPISPAIPIDSGIPEPESASPPTPMDTSPPDAITTSVFSTEAHPSAITETIVVTSSTLMDVSETKKECKGADSIPPAISDVTVTAAMTPASSANIASAGCDVPKFQADVGVTGRTRPSTLPTNPVAIPSTKIPQSTVSQAPAPKSTAVITSKAVSATPHAHKTGQKKSPVASQIKRESVSTEDVQSQLPGTVVAAKVTTTSPGKAQSPATSKVAVLKHDQEQIPSKGDSKKTAEEKKTSFANSSPTSQPIIKPKPSVESPNTVVTDGITATPTSVITTTPQQVPHHHKQMIKSKESATTPKTAELKPPIPPQHDPTLLSKRLEEIVSREALSDETSAEPDVIITAVEKNQPAENTRPTKDVGTATPGKASPKVSAQGQVFMPMVSQTAAVCGSVVQPVYYQVSSKEHPPQYTSNAQPVTHVLYSPNTATLSHAIPTAGQPQPKAVVHHPSSGTAVYYTAVSSDSTAKSGMHPSSVATTKPYAIVNAIPTQPSGDVGYRPAAFPEKVPGVPADGIVGGNDSNKHLHQQRGTVQVVHTAGGRVTQFVANQSTQSGKVRTSEGNPAAGTPSSISRPPPSYSSFVSEKSTAIDEDLQSIQKKIGDAFTQSSEVMLVSAFEDAWKKFQANERAYKEKTGSAVDKPFPSKIVSAEPSIPPNVVVHPPVVSRPRMTGSEKVVRGMPTASQRPIAPKYVHTTIATGPDGQQVALQPVGNTTMMYAIPAQAPASTHPSTGKQQVHVTGLYYPATMDPAPTSQQQSAPEQPQTSVKQHIQTSVTKQHVQTSRAQPHHHHHHHINRSQQGRGGHTKPRGSVTSTGAAGGGGPQNRTIARKTSNNRCAKCGKSATYVCSGCRTEWYCSRDCQLRCWDSHSDVCTA